MAWVIPQMLSEGLRVNIWSVGTLSARKRPERHVPHHPVERLRHQPESFYVKWETSGSMRSQVRAMSKGEDDG